MSRTRLWMTVLFWISVASVLYFSLLGDPLLAETSFFEDMLFYAGVLGSPLSATLTLFFTLIPRFLKPHMPLDRDAQNPRYLVFLWVTVMAGGLLLAFLHAGSR